MTNDDWNELTTYVVEFVYGNTEGANKAEVIQRLKQERPSLEEAYKARFADAVTELLESPLHQFG